MEYYFSQHLYPSHVHEIKCDNFFKMTHDMNTGNKI